MQSKDTLFIMEKFIFIAFLDVMLASLLMFQPVICSSNFTDQVALLHFKSAIEIDPANMIKGGNWTAEANFCEWIGVVCSNRRQSHSFKPLVHGPSGETLSLPRQSFFPGFSSSSQQRFQWEDSDRNRSFAPPESISLMANKLTGGIPREFGAFPKLQALYLSRNELWGQIPSNLGNISTLQVISLSMAGLTGSIPSTFFNRSLTHVILTENHLSGSLPFDLCYRWHNIEILELSVNQFNGLLPETLTQCKELLVLGLSLNHFQGSIPRDIDRLQKLQQLFLGGNNLTGTIPRTIGNMSSLQRRDVTVNYIGGGIPSEIGNLINLEHLGFGSNLLTGKVPRELILAFNSLSGNLFSGSEQSLPNLEVLHLSENRFGGNIPQHISNFTNLITFNAWHNQLSGPIPMSLGDLKNLGIFRAQANQLTGEPYDSELGFLSALSNCQSLRTLALGRNPLLGSIPKSIKNFSNSLQTLTAQECKIRGRIPEEMGFLKRLTLLALSGNDLVGNIPSPIGGLESLQRLYLDDNHLEGPIPNQICNLTSLGDLVLQQNRISGSILNCIGNLSSLQNFFVNSNNMTSAIPISQWSLQELIFLSLSLNSFVGGLPPEIGKMRAMNGIDLSWLDFPDLSYNELLGTIPESMEGLIYLQHLNLSFNKLSGEIPNGGPFKNFLGLSFTGNEALCGNAAFQVPPCKLNEKKSTRNERLQLLSIMLPIVSILLLLFAICLLRKHGNPSKKAPVLVENPLGIDRPMISYRELCLATNNFSKINLLGVGSFSFAYKGTLANGIDIAVKVLNFLIEGALKSFDTECEVFCNIWHRNLVKVISSCTNVDLRALVLQYMPNGSLEKWLYSNNYSLGLHQRMNIMVDIATMIEYLHHGQLEPIVHCDAYNVLLNEELAAQVCDFGIAKILAKNKLETQTRTLGMIGYIAPEYGLEGKVSTKGDVYSFGILLLEVITRKKPTDEMFNADMRLRQWVGAAIPNKVLDIVDS
ncbi:LOW QUALITY PROTEIN: hypothetical protein BT93_L5733 [Corymbia citriodora subsp. variegata]|uniref:Protein kinase domain-containing protein n=1 Tax=Corymbia citriodora subsp. variegata TaxID=360336 RepID=A0A8T0CTX3_CORYI|nr:LOW QUALITY PROTEIN: hypothetical protein BT93_L5733 [Corymbia citriodora subsp. variegata]